MRVEKGGHLQNEQGRWSKKGVVVVFLSVKLVATLLALLARRLCIDGSRLAAVLRSDEALTNNFLSMFAC